ncbi:putative transmembrane protein [Senna tora]|uniref:Putative transmembrane protein n=1 Tax=Senna tora TaxID=362788 RepID=A0A834SLJ5_9FABA|nr:putative transmembrane protein [Senna tora]
MNSSHFFLFCLFTVAIYFLSHHTSSSVDVIPRPARKLSTSIPVVNHEHSKSEVADEAMDIYPDKADSVTLEYTSNSSSLHDLVYHIDYHGVTTHPTPKHPKP